MEKQTSKWAKLFRILLCFVLLGILVVFIKTIFNAKEEITQRYQNGCNSYRAGDYSEAIDILSTLGDYRDCYEIIAQAEKKLRYAAAEALFENGEYSEAAEVFSLIEGFMDSDDRAKQAYELAEFKKEQESKYISAKAALDEKDYVAAFQLLNELDGYKDSQNIIQETKEYLLRLINAKTISAGIEWSGGVTEKGNVLFVGNTYRDSSQIEEWTDIVSICVMGEITMGLKEDGSVVIARGNYEYGSAAVAAANRKTDFRIDVSSWSDIVDVAAGQQYVVGLRADGTLTAQGNDGYGETNIDSWSNIVSIAAGWQQTAGLSADGRVFITGYKDKTLQPEIDKWPRVVSIDVGGGSRHAGAVVEHGHIVGLTPDGHVVAAGDNMSGQCNVSNWENIVAIAAGDFHTVGLTENKTVVTTQTGKIGDEVRSWTDIVAVSAGYGTTLGLKSDGSIVAAGYSKQGQIDVNDWSNIRAYEEWDMVFNDDYWNIINGNL